MSGYPDDRPTRLASPHLSNDANRLVREFPLGRELFGQDGNLVGGGRPIATSIQRLVEAIERSANELSTGRRLNSHVTLTRACFVTIPQLLAISYSTNGVHAVRQREAALNEYIALRYGRVNSATPIPVPAFETPVWSNMPVSHLVPILPEIAYREQHEQPFERTLEYVRIQRSILKAFEKHQTQQTLLTAKEAYNWTKAIVPENTQPTPLQALRLCYYMRSMGFDTFAHVKPVFFPPDEIKRAVLCLFAANPISEERGLGHDNLYWVQNVSDGKITPKPYSLILEDSRASARRNALSVPDVGPPFGVAMNEAITEQ